ncbi:MAG: hypothetical protein AAF417_22715 [Pseudomonadota bacterium]
MTGIALLEFGHAGFEFADLLPQPLGLLGKESGCFCSAFPANSQIFVEVERNQFIRDLLRNASILVFEGNIECDHGRPGPPTARIHDFGANQLHRNLVAKTPGNDVYRFAATLLGVKTELVDDGDQVLGRHDPLLDDLQALGRETRNGRSDELARHLRFFDQNRTGRLIDRRDGNRDHNTDGKHDHGRNDQAKFPAQHGRYVVARPLYVIGNGHSQSTRVIVVGVRTICPYSAPTTAIAM